MRRLCGGDHPPGVVTYRDGLPVGWCNIGPRTEITRLAGSRLIRPVDDLPVWSIVCVVVRSGHRRQGVTAPLIEGAVAYAASHGAPAVEAHPVDPPGRMDLTTAFVGTMSMFQRAGFRVVGTTDAVASGLPRLVMRPRPLIAGPRWAERRGLPAHQCGRPGSRGGGTSCDVPVAKDPVPAASASRELRSQLAVAYRAHRCVRARGGAYPPCRRGWASPVRMQRRMLVQTATVQRVPLGLPVRASVSRPAPEGAARQSLIG